MYNTFSTGNTTYSIGDSFVSELLSYGNLPVGWDSGYGESIPISVVNRAMYLYFKIKNPAFEYESTPISNGSILITACLKDHFLDLMVNEHSCDISYEKGIGSEFSTILEKEDATINDISEILSNIKQACFSLEPSTSQNLVEKNSGFITVFQTLETASPYFHMTVPSKVAQPYATI